MLRIGYAWRSLTEYSFGEGCAMEKNVSVLEANSREWRDNFEKNYCKKHNENEICIISRIEEMK